MNDLEKLGTARGTLYATLFCLKRHIDKIVDDDIFKDLAETIEDLERTLEETKGD